MVSGTSKCGNDAVDVDDACALLMSKSKSPIPLRSKGTGILDKRAVNGVGNDWILEALRAEECLVDEKRFEDVRLPS